ncbi:MAG: winged helix DNA-binding protein [Nitrosopumilus sp.]|jgi:predicted transcriptional regulator|nr:winged helix DNA-binding protein [Nitrosopumilus sp.]
MLIEIPDIEVILSIILAFIAGLGGLYVFYKVRPFVKTTHMEDSSHAERLEYYERQLIDMKIRLDAIELQGIESKTEDSNVELKHFLEKLAKAQGEKIITKPEIQPTEIQQESRRVKNISKIDPNDITEHVLHLITDKAMTSRDIQKALNRSREHTSRFMKKLFEDGLVERNIKTKPYTYLITKKGLERTRTVQSSSTLV